jgi:hypothetical protein
MNLKIRKFEKREPILVGEVIRDLIDRGELLPNYKLKDYGK